MFILVANKFDLIWFDIMHYAYMDFLHLDYIYIIIMCYCVMACNKLLHR